MDIRKLADVKDRFADYEKIFNSGDYDKAADILSAILERIEECTDERKAGTMDDTFVKKSDMDGRPIYISLNHVMEYYVYACYFEPETDVLCTELPVGEYYRTFGSLCLKLSKFRRAEDAFKKADDMANANLSNSEAEYQKDHDSWEYERDNLEEARQQWVKDVEEKQKEHDEWLAVNGAAIEEWNAKKKEYNDNKQKLEYELKRLQEDKGFIEGFMAGAKAAKKDKEIMNVRIELSRLALPKEPIMPKEPVIPPEPALRREPEKPDYDIMIGRNDVLDTFRSLMA